MSAVPLSGQVAVVTGASRGIGKAVAVHLARQGAAVAGIARPGPDLAALAGEAGGAAGRLLGVAVDLRGTMLTARCAIRAMLAAGRGRLVTVYGNLGDRQQGYVSAFAVAKAGVARLTESLACELAGTQVRVLGVHPGFVRTAMTGQLARGEPGRAWLPGFGDTAGRRWGDAKPAAGLITAIALGAADQLTGTILHPGDDLAALTRQCQTQPGRRRLRLDLS